MGHIISEIPGQIISEIVGQMISEKVGQIGAKYSRTAFAVTNNTVMISMYNKKRAYLSVKTYTMKTLLSFFALASLAFYISCDKADEIIPKSEQDKLPPITQEGKNTFGYLLNGEAVVFRSTSNYVAMYQGGFFYLGGGGISIYIHDPVEVDKTYSLLQLPQQKAEYKSINDDNKICYYESTDTFSGYIVISHFDKSDYTISGTFEFSTVIQSCDTVQITHGRFDVQYIP